MRYILLSIFLLLFLPFAKAHEVDAGEDIVGYVGEKINFSGKCINCVNLTRFEWDFDGDGKFDWNSTKTSSTTHVYNKAKVYEAKLRIWDNNGTAETYAEDTVKVTIKEKIDTWMVGLILTLIGIGCIVVEIATPGQTFALIPGTILIIIGILGMFAPDILFFWQFGPVVITIILLVVICPVTIYFYKIVGKGQKPQTLVGESLVGKKGVVTKEIEPNVIKGKVRIENTIWSATADKKIEVGKNVEVVESKGVHVIVKELEEVK
ncbi:MAG: NfeD family protein [Candidatus Thermoplasmatota archaeon]